MKPQAEKAAKTGMIEAVITTILGAVIAAVVIAVYFVGRSVLLPVLRYCVRVALSGMKKGGQVAMANVPAVKQAKVKASLPTPDVFKDATNLAPARQVRF